MSFSFGTPTTSATTGFQLGAGDNKLLQNKPVTNLFGTPTTSTTANASLSFNVSKASTPSFGFGTPSTAASTLSTTFTTSAPTFGLSTTTTTATTTFPSLLPTGSTTTTAQTQPKLSFGLTSTTSSSASIPGIGLTSTTATIPTSQAGTSNTTAPTGTLTFSQLEDSINKWTIDLEEQGKFFINQAKQLNAWDSLLISNGEKILNLNQSIERVKQQQSQLDQELDFVLAQQNELEELIAPLEKELTDIPVSDIDRNQMYQLSEIIDSQLKQMSDDLKEIIEHINESNKDEEMANPVTQISQILNAHMNSLQWIDRNTSQISSHLEQITKIQDANRKNFALNHSFNNI